jgi:DNA-directed RNA polymerase specialized sigma24 family protein
MSDAPSMVLLSRWRQGSDEAAAELYERYAGRLIAFARSRLSPRIARRVEAEDVVQSACRTFFVRTRDGRLEVTPGSDLWQLLVAITLRKVFAQVEYHTAAKRSVGREDSLAGGDSITVTPVDALADDPGAPEVVALHEELNLVLSAMKPLHRQIVELQLRGYSAAETAERVGRTDRMVRIVLGDFAERLRARLRPAETG